MNNTLIVLRTLTDLPRRYRDGSYPVDIQAEQAVNNGYIKKHYSRIIYAHNTVYATFADGTFEVQTVDGIMVLLDSLKIQILNKKDYETFDELVEKFNELKPGWQKPNDLPVNGSVTEQPQTLTFTDSSPLTVEQILEQLDNDLKPYRT